MEIYAWLKDEISKANKSGREDRESVLLEVLGANADEYVIHKKYGELLDQCFFVFGLWSQNADTSAALNGMFDILKDIDNERALKAFQPEIEQETDGVS